MTHGADRRPECVNALHDDCQIHAIPQLCSGSVSLFMGQGSIHYWTPGFPWGLAPPGGLMPSRGEGVTSGFVDMFGSRLGGFTEPRGSPRLSGICWIPGSIRDGGIAGTPDSNALSGAMLGAGPPLLSGNWAGGTTSAATANAGRRVRIATATSRGAFPDHLLVESEWGTLPHLCFDRDILTSSLC